MRKQVLYIDYMCPRGHLGFNIAQVNSLRKLDCDLHFVFREGCARDLNIDRNNVTEIPCILYSSGRLASRLSYMRILRFIKKRTGEQHWDAVIFSSYETISLGLCMVHKGAFLFNHNNLRDLDNWLKRRLFVHIAGKYKPIVFNEQARQKLLCHNIAHTIVIPHGFVPIPETCESDILSRYGLDEKRYILFPGNGVAATKLTPQIIENPNFANYCAGHGIKIVVRTKGVNVSNIVCITDFLSNNEYYTLLRNCFVAVLCYDASFKYRVSAILFECMALNIPAVAYQNESLVEYNHYINSNTFTFSCSEDLCALLDRIAHKGSSPYYKELSYIADSSEAWSNVLNVNLRKSYENKEN